MVREINKQIYVITAIITLGIFLLGLFLGLYVDSKRIQYIQNEGKQQRSDFNSLQLQYQFIDQLSSEKNCPAVLKTFDTSLKELEKTRERLEAYTEQSKIDKEDYEALRREYTIAQLNYFLLAKKAKEICDANISIILYFYAAKQDCPDCIEQGFVLDYLKRIYKDRLLIFALDGKMTEEPMIELLMTSYGITTYPGLVIEDKTQNGFTEKNKVSELICLSFDDNSTCLS